MKKVVRLTEADLINLIKGTINELEHDAEGYAKYVKREDYLNVTSILVQNELIDNGLDVYVEEHSWHTLIVEGHKEEDPNRELNIKHIIIEFETFYDENYELSSDMKLKIYHIGNNVPTFATYDISDGVDLLINLKNKGLLPSTNNETINESFDNRDFIEALSTQVHNELTENGLKVYFLDPAYVTTFPGRLWIKGHETPLPDHPVTISQIQIDFDPSSLYVDSGPYLDMRIDFHGAGNHEAGKSFTIRKGVDFILKLKEEGKLPEGKRPTLKDYDDEEW